VAATVGAACQLWIPTSEQSGLLTRSAVTKNALLRTRMKSWLRLFELERGDLPVRRQCNIAHKIAKQTAYQAKPYTTIR
jgi:hypothetical protein